MHFCWATSSQSAISLQNYLPNFAISLQKYFPNFFTIIPSLIFGQSRSPAFHCLFGSSEAEEAGTVGEAQDESGADRDEERGPAGHGRTVPERHGAPGEVHRAEGGLGERNGQ